MLFQNNHEEDRKNQEWNTSPDNIENGEDEVILPPTPEESVPFCGKENEITYWGFSQQGESHINDGSPCQDRCKVVVSRRKTPVIIAAIADGVGSCLLSHYGAAIATDTATSYLKERIDSLNPNSEIDDKWIGGVLRESFQHALESVRKAADEMEQLEYSFQSTLTVCVYDGSELYLAHSGDDGVLVLTDDGRIELATLRMKGEEISSVYPLQAGPDYWQVAKAGKHVTGFIMATDGVLDSFVMGEAEENRIYYPFIQPVFENQQDSIEKVEEVMNFYDRYLHSERYRKVVTDDLTIVAVTNQKHMERKCFPVFDEDEWNRKTKEYRKRADAILYPNKEIGNLEAECTEGIKSDAGEPKEILDTREQTQQIDQYKEDNENSGLTIRENTLYVLGVWALVIIAGNALGWLILFLFY